VSEASVRKTPRMSDLDRCLRACASGPDSDALFGALLDELDRAMPLMGACWHLADPQSGLPTTAGRAGDPPGDFESSLAFEYQREDVSRFAELADRRHGVGVLSQETHGHPGRSPRFREMIAPAGGQDEMRVALSDTFGVWGYLTLFSSGRFTPEQSELVASVTAALTRSLRLARSAGLEPQHGGPGVLLLDAQDRQVSVDPRARELLSALRPGSELPGIVHVLATLARLRDPSRPASAHAADAVGRWLSIDATAMDEGPQSLVAVVVQPGPETGLLDTILRAHGLSQREREVATLAVRGRTTKEIARQIFLSPWTVQDHLKAIFEKTSVSTRGELATLATVRLAKPVSDRGG
jgi:DNA-binding CsgD family transcriptional regulator